MLSTWEWLLRTVDLGGHPGGKIACILGDGLDHLFVFFNVSGHSGVVVWFIYGRVGGGACLSVSFDWSMWWVDSLVLVGLCDFVVLLFGGSVLVPVLWFVLVVFLYCLFCWSV